MDGVDFIWVHLTQKMKNEMDLVEVADDVACYCCGRISRHWHCKLAEYRLDNYINLEVPICAACNAFFHPSYHYMGIERGTPEAPKTQGKLGMLAGCGLIVTDTESLLLTNPGWHKRLACAADPLCKTIQVSGKEAASFSEDYIASCKSFPLVYIPDLGRKKAELIRNLNYTRNAEKIVACTADEVIEKDMGLIRQIRCYAESSPAAWKRFRKFIFDSSHGRIAPADPDLNQFLTIDDTALSIAKQLPADPHAKLQMLRAV